MPMPETPRPYRPGRDPLPDERLAEIRAEVDDNDGRGLRLQEAIELLGELDRIQPLLATTLDANGKLLDHWGRYVGVAATIGGVFCRTCRTEVQPGTEGCTKHSPTVVGRELYRLHDESRALPMAERNARAYELLDTVLPLLAAVLNPVDHAEGCRPHDCRCACDRRQNCQDCHRCVCWRSQCCAEKAIRWHAEDRWARLVAEAGHGPEGSDAEDDGPRCAACQTPIAEHQGRICPRPATRYC
ncbi:hypothetical protein ACWDQZ_27585 [Streptomyces tendae]